MYKLFIVLMLVGFEAKADSTAYGVNWDHLGTSYMLTTISYGFVKCLDQAAATKSHPRMSRLQIVGISMLLSFGASTAYSYGTNPQGWPRSDASKLMWNVVGAGLSALTTITFRF